MDTSTVAVRKDTLGRPVVPRRLRSLEDKLKLIAEARAAGATVSSVARKHGVNANLLFGWMRQQEQGVLMVRTRPSRPRLLAVTVAPSATTSGEPVSPSPSEQLEITLPDRTCIRATGAVSIERLEQLVRLLRR
jgi:transposase-like protein